MRNRIIASIAALAAVFSFGLASASPASAGRHDSARLPALSNVQTTVFTPVTTTVLVTGWTAYQKCSFNVTAWENVRVHVIDNGVGSYLDQLQASGTETVDKVNYLDTARNGVSVGKKLVNSVVSPARGAFTKTGFTTTSIANSQRQQWKASLHRTNGTILASCATGQIDF